MNIKDWIKVKIIGYKATSESYIKYLKKKGIVVGEDVVLYRPFNTTVDVQNPHLLSIGNHVMITGPVTILTHDYSWCVIKYKVGNIIGNQKPVKIGNNIFIGWGATILAGTTIGDNSIIGANSVVHGKLDGNAVYAGNPAKEIMSLEEYYQKRIDSQLEDAITVVFEYYQRTGNYPSPDILNEYFFLFADSSNTELIELYDSQLQLMGSYEKSMNQLVNNEPRFKGYDEFIIYCKRRFSREFDK